MQAVAALAEHFGIEINMPLDAWFCGILHDFGKYSQSFQKVLNGTATNIDHAICAAVIVQVCVIKKEKKLPAYRTIAEVTAAHHSFLRSYGSMEAELSELFAGVGTGLCKTGKKSALFGKEEYSKALSAFLCDFPTFKFKKLEKRTENSAEKMLRTRMLFSCLVDADYTVSSEQTLEEREGLQAEKLLQDLQVYMDKLRKKSHADKKLNQLRDNVFQICGNAGKMPPGLFTLTAPTGVGKTLSLLHFALQHCVTFGKRRILLVLPFLTLTEQSQKEYEKLIPHILADHSQSRLSKEHRDLAARWDAPFIITTSVRFFESLFSCHPKDCRKLHNIAQSVILFDEAQSLPANLSTATIQAVEALCNDYGCTMVFSSATQPDFGALPNLKGWNPKEILPDFKPYYEALRRTRVDWRLKRPTSFETIAKEMSQRESVCTIVNLRRHAVKLFKALKKECPQSEQDSLFFLTTDLCPAHRSDVIEAIKARLQNHLPCRVVATQCIEAGVDLDFQFMYRALAPLEAIIQAAGRCNRNGTLPGGGIVTVFIPEDAGRLYPGDSYQKGAEIVKIMWSSSEDLDIHNPENIKKYYQYLLRQAKDKPELTNAIKSEDYETVENEYKLIAKQGVQVLVPYAHKRDLFDQLCQQARTDGVSPALMKEAAPITVSCYNEEIVRQHCEQIPWYKRRTDTSVESDFYILTTGHEVCYQPDMGLQFTNLDINDEIFMI